jgi:glycine C-acetyltransferase
MDGYLAKLDAICDLCAEKYDAMVMVDDSHATGFIGKTGRGTPEHCGVMRPRRRRDRARSARPSAAPPAASPRARRRWSRCSASARGRTSSRTPSPPAIVGASIAVLDLPRRTTELRDKVMANAPLPRGMTAAGFTIKPGIHPIVPVMLGDARLAQRMAPRCWRRGST